MMVSLPQHKVLPSKARTFVILIFSCLILYVFSIAKNYNLQSLNATRVMQGTDILYPTFLEKWEWNENERLTHNSDEPYILGCYLYRSPRSGKGPKVQENTHSVLRVRQCMKRLPSVFIIGVKKSGTTTLTKYLDLHQQIAMAFRAKITNNASLGIALHKYHMMMPYSEPAQTVVAAFPGYYRGIRDKFFKLLPFMPKDPKFIVILRDPVARTVSDYLHITLLHKPSTSSNGTEWHHRGNILKSTFEETVLTQNGKVNDTLEIIRVGIYSEGLQDFVNAVSRKNILILSGDYFSKNPLPTLRKVENFLGLKSFYREDYFQYIEEKRFYCAAVPSRPDVSCMSKHKGRTHPNISDFVLRKLRDFYRPYNLRLGKEFELSPVEFEWTQQ